MHHLTLQDKPWQFSDTTTVEHEIFQVDTIAVRPFEYVHRGHFCVTFEMSLDLLATERTVYGFLDWIGNIGGLFDGLMLFFGLLVSLWNYKFY